MIKILTKLEDGSYRLLIWSHGLRQQSQNTNTCAEYKHKTNGGVSVCISCVLVFFYLSVLVWSESFECSCRPCPDSANPTYLAIARTHWLNSIIELDQQNPHLLDILFLFFLLVILTRQKGWILKWTHGRVNRLRIKADQDPGLNKVWIEWVYWMNH